MAPREGFSSSPDLEDEDTTMTVTAPLAVRWLRTVAATSVPNSDPLLMRLAPGRAVGRYRLVTEIGHGGMATVWIGIRPIRADQIEVVALKLMFPHLSTDRHQLQMFLDEAKLLSLIQHPNVVRIRDVGSYLGVPYVALDWVDGESLEGLLRVLETEGQRVPLPIALRIVGEVCLGLHAAHELRGEDGELRNVVHRDVTPGNVLLSASGDVRLIDFGIAKAADRLVDSTTTGELKGKVSYLAPEQLRRERPDRRTDIWAAGVLLYQLVSGRLPHEGDIVEVLLQIQRGAPGHPLPADVPPSIVEVVRRAMSSRREDRYESAAEMRRAVQYAYASLGATLSRPQFAAYLMEHLGGRIADRRALLSRALDDMAVTNHY